MNGRFEARQMQMELAEVDMKLWEELASVFSERG